MPTAASLLQPAKGEAAKLPGTTRTIGIAHTAYQGCSPLVGAPAATGTPLTQRRSCRCGALVCVPAVCNGCRFQALVDIQGALVHLLAFGVQRTLQLETAMTHRARNHTNNSRAAGNHERSMNDANDGGAIDEYIAMKGASDERSHQARSASASSPSGSSRRLPSWPVDRFCGRSNMQLVVTRCSKHYDAACRRLPS